MAPETQAQDQSMSDDDRQSIERLRHAHDQLRSELSKIIVGQDQVIEHLLVAIFAQGHCARTGKNTDGQQSRPHARPCL